MAACIQIKQLLQDLCKGEEVKGRASIVLGGGTPCQLFDPIAEAWVTPGRVGTFNVGDILATGWQSCPLWCLDELVGPGGVPASELGFYYTIEVAVGGSKCEYEVLLDCEALGLVDGDTVCLEDVILQTPIPGTGNPICDAIAACTGGGGVAFSCSDLAGCPIDSLSDVSSTAPAPGEVLAWNGTEWEATTITGGGTETTTTLVNNGDGTFTYLNEVGASTTIDICTIVAGNCSDALVDNGDGTYTHTAVDGSVTTLNLGGCCSFSSTVCSTVTGLPVYVTGIIDEGTGGFAAGPIYTNPNGSPYTGNVANLGPCGGGTGGAGDGFVSNVALSGTNLVFTGSGGGYSGTVDLSTLGGGGSFTCSDLASCSIEALGDVAPMVPAAGEVLTWNGSQWASAPGGGGGTGVVTTLVDNGDGTLTYTNELGALATFRSNDREKVVFAHRDLVTEVSCSGHDIDHVEREIYCVAVTVDVAPTGTETFDLVDTGPAGTGNTIIYTGSLAAGQLTTGLLTIPTYLLAAGNLMHSNITAVAGSEKWHLHVFYRETTSELEI